VKHPTVPYREVPAQTHTEQDYEKLNKKLRDVRKSSKPVSLNKDYDNILDIKLFNIPAQQLDDPDKLKTRTPTIPKRSSRF